MGSGLTRSKFVRINGWRAPHRSVIFLPSAIPYAGFGNFPVRGTPRFIPQDSRYCDFDAAGLVAFEKYLVSLMDLRPIVAPQHPARRQRYCVPSQLSLYFNRIRFLTDSALHVLADLYLTIRSS